jgi:hypothetical protein
MTRTILIAVAAVAALATAPSFAASAMTWEQEARQYAPYAFGNPIVLTDSVETGSIEASLDYYHYYTGYVSSVGDASVPSIDDTKTGGIGSAEPRVDVEGFCEGEGKLLAERHYVGFCHLAD